MNRTRGAVAGVVLAAVVVLLRQNGWLGGWPAVLLTVILVLAVPTSRLFSRRVLLAGLLVLGWIPLLWWVHLPLGTVGRATLLLAGLAGGLGGWVLAGDARERLARLVPDWRLLDLLPLGVGAVALLQLASWFTVTVPRLALAHLMNGWDGAPHFDIYNMVRRLGVTIEAAGPAPDGSTWYPNGYPTGFHTVTATLVELATGPKAGSVQQELVRYLHAQPVIYAASVTMVLAGLVSLPWLRRRRGLAVLASALVGVFLVGGLGASYVGNSNLNFLLALCLGIGAIELAVVMPRALAPLPLAALLGGLVGVANGWSLLVALFAPVVLLALLPLRRSRFRLARREVPWLVLVVVGTLLGAWHATSVLLLVAGQSFLSIPGYTPLQPAWLVLTLDGLALVVPLSYGRGSGVTELLGGLRARRFALFAFPLTALLLAGAIALVELRQGTGLQYYFWKMFVGAELVSLVVAVVAAVAHPGTERLLVRLDSRLSEVGRGLRLAAIACLAMLITQVFGWFFPLAARVPARVPVSPGTRLAALARNVTVDQLNLSAHLFAAIPVQQANQGRIVVFLPVPPADNANLAWAELWYRGLNADLTTHTQTVARVPTVNLAGPATAGLVARYLFQQPGNLVVVAPSVREDVRGTLPVGQRSRVVSW